MSSQRSQTSHRIADADQYLFNEGTYKQLWKLLGAHVGDTGTHFAVWAPHAKAVQVLGDFNAWNVGGTVMRPVGTTGIWECWVEGVGEGCRYKYRIESRNGAIQPLKADPFGFGAEHPPDTASVVRDISGYGWRDANWLQKREWRNSRQAPISIYEVHLGSWKRHVDDGNRPLSYREAAEELVDYVAEMGFTHIEFLPLTEHPFDGSWGYQPVGLFAPTVRHGPPHEFRDLVDAAHQRGISVLLDWVPAHFPTDAHGLARFDGTALYEHEDPRQGFHQDWQTLIFNYGRREVANYLLSNALYWLEEYHVDGLRVDAVASMLYLDYSRNEGEWIPNKFGGRENLDAIEVLKQMNTVVYGNVPGIMTVAEESTAYPMVSGAVHAGGLGFGFKWNMGWMNDTLEYIGMDPIHRRYHHHKMTFGTEYAFSENFILPISHDEVVHGKGSMYERMPGNEWERLANLRTYYGFMWGHPGKKLLFMGCEFAQPREWAQGAQLDWDAASRPEHAGIARLVRDLNVLYRDLPALHLKDCEADGFQWIEANDAERSLFAWLRRGADGEPPVVIVCNFTPVRRTDWRLGLPQAGRWREALNTDAAIYGGSEDTWSDAVETEAIQHCGQPFSAAVTLPPLSTVFLIPADT